MQALEQRNGWEIANTTDFNTSATVLDGRSVQKNSAVFPHPCHMLIPGRKQ